MAEEPNQPSKPKVEPHGQEPVAPAVRRNPPKLQSSFAKASEDTRIPPPPGDGGFPRSRVKVPLRIEETVAGITIGLLALITFANVVVRYATNFSFAFTEEFSIFLMVFMALVGGSSVMAKGGHLNISFIVDKFPRPIRKKIRIVSTIIVGITFALLVILGGRMAYDEYRFEVTSPGLGIPTWIYTTWLPILSLLILCRTVGVLIRIWRERT